MACYRLAVQCKRVQNFIFEVPRMRAMLGANTLLGETLRLEFTGRYLIQRSEYLHQPLPISADMEQRLSLIGSDALSDALGTWREDRRFSSYMKERGFDEWLLDDPLKAWKHGILARDGGHFTVLFSDDDDRSAFEHLSAFVSKHVRPLLGERLPGMRYEIRADRFKETKDGKWGWEPVSLEQEDALEERLPIDLPAFSRCAETAQKPAEQDLRMPEYMVAEGMEPRTVHVSREVQIRHTHGENFVHYEPLSSSVRERLRLGNKENYRPTADLVSLMRGALPLHASAGSDKTGKSDPDPKACRWPTDFDELTAGGYLAVIQADGNAVGDRARAILTRDGKRIKTWRDFSAWFDHESRIEALYHQMRVIVRNAVASALTKTFREFQPRPNRHAKNKRMREVPPRPYQLLMLGGDDLLLVLQARYALPFVLEYAKEIQAECETGSYPDFKDNPLTIGAGVVIAHHTLPFHRLQELADNLAGSAKRLYRALAPADEKAASVVDWTVCTNSWAAEPEENRGHFDVLAATGSRIALSAKPYRVLAATGKDGKPLPSLQALLDADRELERAEKEARSSGAANSDRAARSQLKNLPQELRRGESMGELAYRELPDDTCKALARISGKEKPWRDVTSGGARHVLTEVCDFIEIHEISSLGKRPATQNRT